MAAESDYLYTMDDREILRLLLMASHKSKAPGLLINYRLSSGAMTFLDSSSPLHPWRVVQEALRVRSEQKETL